MRSPATERVPGRTGPPRLAHYLPPGKEIRPGEVAYCGTRILGVPAPRDVQDCTMCRAIRDERKGKL